MTVLSVESLKKTIGKKEIIKNISFQVKEGEVFGFLGPNGAGKTTTIRMLVGLIRPTSGKITICGYDVQKQFIEAMRAIGSIVENPELYKFLSGRENLEQFARMLGPVDRRRIEEVIHLVELDKRIDDKVKTYSLGMRQRLGIAQALLGKPRLLILDEPTNGLDPAGIRELRSFVKKLAHEEGISVFVSSHMLGEVQMMCDRVAIISHGQIIREATVKELIDAEYGNVEWVAEPADEALKLLQSHSTITDLTKNEDGTLVCRMLFQQMDEVNDALVKHGIKVSGLRRLPHTLEDLFLELTGGDHIE